MSAFDFNNGFTDYVDLKPRLYFGAGYSASKLALYDGLRMARQMVMARLTRKLAITDFYQPAEVVTRTVLEWIDSAERPKDAPFFLFVHYMDTHDPFMDYSRPGIGYARVRLGNPDPGQYLEPMKQAYISDIEHLDTHLGLLLDGLRQRGLYDDAVVMFTADHGEEFYDHKGWWHGQTLFDELIRVPLLLKLPKQDKAGTVNSDFARHVDIGPTLLHFAGAKPDPKMPGRAVIGADGAFTNKDIGFVYAENDFENNVMQSARTRDAKIIRANADNPRGHQPCEFYRLDQDPLERTPLECGAETGHAPLAELLDNMLAFTKGNTAEPSVAPRISDEQREQLKGLGYLGSE